jgi:excisionase family DNA binding protein
MSALTTQQAADRLGVTPRRVVAMIHALQLPAIKFGRDYMIETTDLKLVKNRKVGRPRKPKKHE